MNLRDGSVSRDSAEAVRALMEQGLPVTKAIEHIATERGRSVKTISSAYYRHFRHGMRRDARTIGYPSLIHSLHPSEGDQELQRLLNLIRTSLDALEEHLATRDAQSRQLAQSILGATPTTRE